MPLEISIQWEIVTAVGIPAVIAAIGIIRYFWKKEQCFVTMKHKIDELAKSDEGSNDTHSDLYSKMNRIERNLFHLMGKLEVKPVD